VAGYNIQNNTSDTEVDYDYGGGNGNHDDGWIPPEDLEPQISRFNAMQRIVYRSIRSEVGAGAANFVKSCGGSVEDRFGDRLGRSVAHGTILPDASAIYARDEISRRRGVFGSRYPSWTTPPSMRR